MEPQLHKITMTGGTLGKYDWWWRLRGSGSGDYD